MFSLMETLFLFVGVVVMGAIMIMGWKSHKMKDEDKETKE